MGVAESTVRGWHRDNRDGFAARYEAARGMMIDCFADEIVLTRSCCSRIATTWNPTTSA